LLLQKLFSFMQSHLSLLSFSCWAIWIQFRKSFPMPINSNVFPTLSCTSFKVTGLLLRCLIHFELIFVQCEKHRSSVSFLHSYIQFSQKHFLKRLSFLIIYFGCLCQKSSECNCMDSYLDLLFYFIGFHICFSASTMMFSLWFCSIAWRQVLWHLQYCSFCSVVV
jgi:hypothetical protein